MAYDAETAALEAERELAEADLDDISVGDARVCPRHPWVAISSPDGLFDAPCGCCESESDAYARAEDEISALEPSAPSTPVVPPPAVPEDEIPF